MHKTLDIARHLLHNSSKVLVLAGAGMSAELGTPTYWTGASAKYGEGETEFGFSPLEHATEDLWEIVPEIQALYFQRSFLSMKSNQKSLDSHYTALLNFLNEMNKEYFVSTTNVDGAFLDAQLDENLLYEIHGAYRNSQCLLEPTMHGIFKTTDPALDVAHCPTCGNLARPNVMFFNDFHFNQGRTLVQQLSYSDFEQHLQPSDSVILEIGAGTSVPVLRNYSVRLNGRLDIPVIRLNPNKAVGVDGIAKLIPRSKVSPFVEIELSASQGVNLLTR